MVVPPDNESTQAIVCCRDNPLAQRDRVIVDSGLVTDRLLIRYVAVMHADVRPGLAGACPLCFKVIDNMDAAAGRTLA